MFLMKNETIKRKIKIKGNTIEKMKRKV